MEKTIEDLGNLPDDLSGVFWVTGITGDPVMEYENIKNAEKNLKINLKNLKLKIFLASFISYQFSFLLKTKLRE